VKNASPAAIAVVKITDENRAALGRIALSMYLGMQCGYCGSKFNTLESFETAVRDHDFDGEFRIAHKSCFEEAKDG
jgi:hypothetical protein